MYFIETNPKPPNYFFIQEFNKFISQKKPNRTLSQLLGDWDSQHNLPDMFEKIIHDKIQH